MIGCRWQSPCGNQEPLRIPSVYRIPTSMLLRRFLGVFVKTRGYSVQYGRFAGFYRAFFAVFTHGKGTEVIEIPYERPADEVQEFLAAVVKGFCPECGKAVYQKPRGRRKKFCSDACRLTWKNKHPKPENWKSTRTAVCPVCGKEFLASREYKSKRMYCSHACANRGRALKKEEGGAT